MKTLSFISAFVLALLIATPSYAYFRTYEGPSVPNGTVRMTYIRGKGTRVLSNRTTVSHLPKYIVRTGSGVPTDWPEWIDPPSWILGN